MKDFKLKDKSMKIKEMSIDDIDYCNDMPHIIYENDKVVSITNLSKARTSWIRKGLEGADDKFIKSLSEDEKSDVSMAVQEYQRLGE